MYRKLSLILFFFAINSNAENNLIEYDKVMSVDGYDLGYRCKGVGKPITILEPPSGNASEEAFKNVFDSFSKTNKTCIYARLGNGNDNRAEGLDLSGWDYIRQLKELIRLEAKEEPLILVGYSYGSFVARLYASEQPNIVKGLLLIDPPHHEWLQSMKREMIPEDWNKMEGILAWFKKRRGHNVWDTQFEVEKSKLRHDLPVIIVSRGQDEIKIKKANMTEKGFRQFNDLHFNYLKELEKLTNNTEHFIAPKSRHMILDYEPDVVIKAFEKLNKVISSS